MRLRRLLRLILRSRLIRLRLKRKPRRRLIRLRLRYQRNAIFGLPPFIV